MNIFLFAIITIGLFLFLGLPGYTRHMSVPLDDGKDIQQDGLVLKKVASLTISKADLETKIYKPKFVPEKLDFQLYEKFEGEFLQSINK